MPLNNIFIDSIRGKIGFIVCDTQMLSIDAQCPEVADQLGGTIATHRLRLAHLPAAPVHQIVATQANAHSRAQITNRCFLGGGVIMPNQVGCFLCLPILLQLLEAIAPNVGQCAGLAAVLVGHQFARHKRVQRVGAGQMEVDLWWMERASEWTKHKRVKYSVSNRYKYNNKY